LTREKIAAAAIEIVRSEGQAALSMRKVAGLFGVDVAALYRHFRNKDELLADVGRLASEMVDLEAPTKGSWEQRFLELAEKIRDRIARHPELGIYGGSSPWATPFFARANGLIAALFCEAGLEGPQLVFATQTVLHLVTSMAQSEVMTRSTPRELNRAFAKTIHDHLPEEVQKAWPSTSARHDWSVDFDALFEFAVRSTLGAVAPESVRSRAGKGVRTRVRTR
jgi:AcrR family transcriptional regulator